MLRDEARMEAYYQAIMSNPEDFRGKTVLDLGAGTAILSCWCASVGAAKVYAVEASGIAEQAELVVARNGYSSVVQIIQAKIEDIQLPEKVDIIISEWMGSFLLFESMLESVLFARDRWLKEDGKMYPASARIFVAPANVDFLYEKKVDFLKQVKGVDLSVLVPFATKEITSWALRGRKVKAECVLSSPAVVKELNIRTVVPDDLKKFLAPFSFKPKREAELHGFVAWFDVTFPAADGNKERDVVLSTSPDKKLTHWRHDLYLLQNPVHVTPQDEIKGMVRFIQNVYWKRHYNIEFSFDVAQKNIYQMFAS